MPQQHKGIKANATLLRSPIHCLSLGFGSGLSKHLPGTTGTIAAIPPYLLFAQLELFSYGVILTLAFILGIFVCGKTAKLLGGRDHKAIVWDEFVGFWLTMFLMPPDWEWIVMGFLLFRFFDIFKPWPIGWLDKHFHGGFGIMADDAMAGFFAFLCLNGLNALIQI